MNLFAKLWVIGWLAGAVAFIVFLQVSFG